MKDIISDWYNGVKSLLPENYTESGVMLLDKIVAALNKYLQSGNNSDYQEYLSLKSQWKALNIPGLNGWGRSSWKHYDSYKKWSSILCNSRFKIR